MTRLLCTLGLMTLLLLGSGCQVLDALSAPRPEVKITSARVGEVSAEGFDLNMNLAVSNLADGRSLPVNRLPFDLALNGQNVLSATASLTGNVPAGESRDFSFDATVPWESVANVARTLEQRDEFTSLDYTFAGRLELPEYDFVGIVPVSHEGTLDLREILQKAIRNPSVFADPGFQQLLREATPVARDLIPLGTLNSPSQP